VAVGGNWLVASDLLSTGRGFDSWSGRYVVTSWMGDCLRNGKPSVYNPH